MLMFKFSVLVHIIAQVRLAKVASVATFAPFLVSLVMILTPNI